MNIKNINKVILPEIVSGGLTKGARRKAQILEAALKNYARLGIEGTTFETVAESCNVTRPLIQHYFRNREDLFGAVINYVRANFQNYAVKALEKGTTPASKLSYYVLSTFEWIEEYPQHARVWLLFLHRTTYQRKKRIQNTELSKIGHERIIALLTVGIEAGEFECKDLATSAKVIQTVIAGALLTLGTEELSLDRKTYVQRILTLCMDIAGYRNNRY